MKKYIVMFGLTLVMGLFFANNAIAQSDWGDNPTTTPFAIGIGDLANPSAANMLEIYRNSVSNIRITRDLPGNGPVGRLQVLNSGNDAMLNIVLRRENGNDEMLQSARDSNGEWLEYLYLNLDTRKYEIRPGVGLTQWRNSGHILFNNDGAVAIGILEADADTKLEGIALGVNGTIKATELIVEHYEDWPDFVFADDYELMSLYEVENYIKQNRHLPNVPSEAHVLENGVNVGEMTSILLQKVEELTLHIIELNKRIEELEK